MNNPQNAPKGVIQVLFVAAEADPLIKVGGLGDVAGSLPPALRALDPEQTGGYLLDVRLVIPFHGAISLCPDNCKPVSVFSVPRPGGAVEARAFMAESSALPVYLIAGEPIREDAPVYSMNTAQDGEKYTFFSLAALELARSLNWQPDVLHANDWHTAISVYALRLYQDRLDSFFANTHSVLTIHNLPFLGGGVEGALRSFGIPPCDDPFLPDWARSFPLAMGLATADEIVAVSPTYAHEILTPEFGSGLPDFLKRRENRISGILNGLDMDTWDPAADSALARNYSAASINNRRANKSALQAEFDLDAEPDLPLLIFIGRMDQQKGVDLAVEGLRQVTDEPWQAILLGTGDPVLENECRRLEADFPGRVRTAIRFDPRLSRRMYAGADMLLMPSRYEPCGLAQMIGMRYGCTPVARAVGGLRDTIIDLPDPAQSTGFLFDSATPFALADTLRRAMDQFRDRPAWKARQLNGMAQDFSWQRSAIAYSGIYTNWRMRS